MCKPPCTLCLGQPAAGSERCQLGSSVPFQRANRHPLGRKPQEPLQKLWVTIRRNKETPWARTRAQPAACPPPSQEPRAAERRGGEAGTPRAPPSLAGPRTAAARRRDRRSRHLQVTSRSLVRERLDRLRNKLLHLPLACPGSLTLCPKPPFAFRKRPCSSDPLVRHQPQPESGRCHAGLAGPCPQLSAPLRTAAGLCRVAGLLPAGLPAPGRAAAQPTTPTALGELCRPRSAFTARCCLARAPGAGRGLQNPGRGW